MAIVTYGTPAYQRHVTGDLVHDFYVVNGATGSTLPTNQSNILWVANQPFTQAGTASLITGISVASSTTGAVLTLTSSGTMVNEVIEVISRRG
jgi:hypothetical protein